MALSDGPDGEQKPRNATFFQEISVSTPRQVAGSSTPPRTFSAFLCHTLKEMNITEHSTVQDAPKQAGFEIECPAYSDNEFGTW